MTTPAKELNVAVVDPEKSLENEAESTVVTITYDGVEYTFDTDDMDDVEFMLAMEKEQLATAIQILLGKAQFHKFVFKKRKLKELNDRVELMFEEKGASPGE